MKEITIAEYPYEMFCVGCDEIVAFLNYIPIGGQAITIKGAINLDGTFPKMGDRIFCKCPSKNYQKWGARPRRYPHFYAE